MRYLKHGFTRKSYTTLLAVKNHRILNSRTGIQPHVRSVGEIQADTLTGRDLKGGVLRRDFTIGMRPHPIQSTGKKKQPGSNTRRIPDHFAECPGTFGAPLYRANYLMNQNTLKNETNPINVPLMILGILLIPFLNLLFFFRRAFPGQIAIYYLVLHVVFQLAFYIYYE